MLRQSKSALDEEIASALYKWRMAAAYYESARMATLWNTPYMSWRRQSAATHIFSG